MALLKQKRGIFFTITALLLISLLFISYTFYLDSRHAKSTRQRVETMNSFLFSLEQDLQREMYISTFRTIFLLENHISQTGTYLTTIDPLFQEAFFNGTLYQQPQELMLGVTFGDIQQNAREKARKIDVNITLNNPVFSVTHDSPWYVKATLQAELDFKDDNNLAAWNKTEVLVAYIPVQGFEDPLYLISTNGLMTNQIIKTPYNSFTQGTDIQNLSAHATNLYYTNSSLAPSFLQRLQGQTTSSPYGIESLVNLNKLSAAGVSVKDTTVVDYLYFTTSSDTNYQIQGMPGWFKLDQSHLSLYQASNLTL